MIRKFLVAMIAGVVIVAVVQPAFGTGAEESAAAEVLEYTFGQMYPGDARHFGFDNPNDVVTRYVEEKFNIRVSEVISTAGVSALEHLNMMVAANDVPDVIYIGHPTISAVWATDMFADLTPYQSSLPNLDRYWPDIAWDYLTIEGKLVALPMGGLSGDLDTGSLEISSLLEDDLHYRPMNNWGMVVREDILQQLGYSFKTVAQIQSELDAQPRRINEEDMLITPAISTFEEFEKFLYQIKDLNIQVDGNPLYPLGMPEWTLYHFSALVVPHGGYYFDKQTGETGFGFGNPGYKEYLQTLRKWAQDGIIDPNWMIDKHDVLQLKAATGRYAILMWVPDMKAVREQAGEFKPILWPALSSGRKQVIDPMFPPGFGNYMIKKDFEDIPRLIEYFDWFSTDEAMDLQTWGPESAGLWELRDGRKVFKDESFWHAVRDGGKTADGKSAEYYGIFDIKHGIDARTSKAFLAAPGPPYNFKSYVYSYPVQLDAWADLLNYVTSRMLGRDGLTLPPMGEASSELVGYWWSTARFDAANAIFADDDAAFEAAWDELMSDFREKGGYDAAIKELAEVFERIHQQ